MMDYDKVSFIDGLKRSDEDHETPLRTRWFADEYIPKTPEPKTFWFIDDLETGDTVSRCDTPEQAHDTWKALGGRQSGCIIRQYEETIEDVIYKNW